MAVNGKSRRSYRGAPVSNTLGTTLNAAATGITLAVAVSGWSTDAEPFFVVVDPGTTKEEKICVKYASATTLTVVDPASTSTWGASVNGRGADNTTDREHLQGAVIYPVFTAVEANQVNELVSKYANAGSVVYQGSGTPGTFTELAIGTASHVLRVNSGLPQWGQVATDGIADSAITTAKILDGTIVLGDLATALQRFLVPVGSINAYPAAAAPTGWLLCDGSAFSSATYPSLYALLGNVATTPDMKGRFPIGDNSTLTLLGTGGSLKVTEANLPSHSHTFSATSAAMNQNATLNHTVVDGGHSHTIDTLDPYYGGSVIGVIEPGFAASAGDEANVVNSVTTGISVNPHDVSHTHTVSGTTGTGSGSGTDYYPPYLVVNYIIKHD
jgi:microcystin-dependent protein